MIPSRSQRSPACPPRSPATSDRELHLRDGWRWTTSQIKTTPSTEWSCIFYRDQEPVHEDNFYVQVVRPNTQTVKRSITNFGGTFNRAQCRLLDVR
jgi:hypothetical protein